MFVFSGIGLTLFVSDLDPFLLLSTIITLQPAPPLGGFFQRSQSFPQTGVMIS